MAKEVIFYMKDVSAGYTNEPLFKQVNILLHRGDCFTLVGKNGTGKSSLFNVIDKTLEIENGEIFRLEPLTVTRLDQDPKNPKKSITALQYAMSIGDMEKYKVVSLLKELGINPEMEASTMSGGQIRKTSLAGVIACQPDILLLDEPTNHLDLNAIEWLEKEIKSFNGAVVVISHDRRFLSNVSNGVFWLEDQSVKILNKSFKYFEQWQDDVYEQEQKKFNKLQQHIKQEERYALRGVTARRKRNQARLERLSRLRQERKNRKNPQQATIIASDNKSASKMIFETKNISKKFGDTVICQDFSLRVLKGDTIGIVGGNGTGKSTLLKLLLKQINPDSGQIRKAKHLEIAYFDQYREQLDPKLTPFELLGNGGQYINVNGKDIHIVGYLKRFLFTYDEIKSKISTLSGGQKNRLLLAKILAKQSDVMILDEPTNDLDMDTLDVLEDMLASYNGTLIIVSHDRDFVGRLCSALLVMQGGGKITEIIGDWDDYIRQQKNGNSVKKPSALKKEKVELSRPEPLPANEKNQKLSPKEQHALKNLPLQIDELNKNIDKMKKILQNQKLYTQDAETFSAVANALATSQDTLSILEEQWLKLTIKSEQMK
ncbi:MAG: ABC-F family ATP-binding cassette domain-containing protein [Alphaproteobacteria bacterium]|nr:ABC-F family ATP-binding cassette domain-containing protein [Alphaproteobacteria bacterium]